MARILVRAATLLGLAALAACASSIEAFQGNGAGGAGGGEGGNGGAGGSGSTTGTTTTTTGSTGPCIYKEDCAAFTDACNEGNCINGSCTKLPAFDGAACDDGLFCTDVDTCSGGVCVGGGQKACPAPDSCHLGVCDEAAKSCGSVSGNDGASCDDGDPCTLSGFCAAGTCSKGAPVDCSGWNGPCAVGICDPAKNGCVAEPKVNGTGCDDGLFCTDGDACKGGVCAGTPKECSPPEDICQTGKCDEATKKCVVVAGNDGKACDDLSACTKDGTCSGGKCVGAPPTNDGAMCDDKDACTLGTKCTAGICGSPASVIESCTNGDGCCPGGCTFQNDDDCLSGVFVGTLGAQNFFKVEVLGLMTDTNVRNACLAAGLDVGCQAQPGCQYNDALCIPTQENSCGNPMQTLAQKICNTSPAQCPPLQGVYQYMGQSWVNGSACGAEVSGWCTIGNQMSDRWALCVQK